VIRKCGFKQEGCTLNTPSEFDLFIQNTTIVDGTGDPAFGSNIGIKDGKIQYIGKQHGKSKQLIDGEGFITAPGFIDTHAHDEGYIFRDHSLLAKLSQGITTDISGNCGISIAPVNGRYLNEFKHLTGGMLNVPLLSEFISFGRFMDQIDALNAGIHTAYFVGLNTIRLAVMGLEMREPTTEERNAMKSYLIEALDSGAIGMSTGMAYPPACFAKNDEILELVNILGEKGGVYASHIRSEGEQLVESVEEVINIGRRTGVPVIVSHHKALGRNNWGKVQKTLSLIEQANQEGVEVGLDVYPYTANSTGFVYILPPSYRGLKREQLLEQLSDSAVRKTVKNDILSNKERYDNMVLYCGLDHILIAAADATPEAVGKTVTVYAKAIGVDPFDAALDILIQNDLNVLAVFFSIADEDMEAVLQFQHSAIGTDGMPIESSITHPRIKGTFPRVLGRYVREKKILTLEDAIRKMTSLPAQRYRLKNKGLIQEGFDADLVLFDAAKIIDHADYVNCFAENEGIHQVIVNGKIAYQNNQYTGAGSGRLLRRE